MSHAKDDPSMLHAVNGYARWNETGDQVDWSGAESPILCPTDVSNAVTPRDSSMASPSGSGSRTPSADAPFPSARPRNVPSTSVSSADVACSSSRTVPAQTRENAQGMPIKVEFSLSPAMLQQMAGGHQNICLVVKGLNTSGKVSAVDLKFSDASSVPESTGNGQGSVVKLEVEDDLAELAPASQSPHAGMSDQDLIAMLAECAAKPATPLWEEQDKFAQVLSERINAVADELRHGGSAEASLVCDEADVSMETADVSMDCMRMHHLEPGDEELMAALANCCGGQSPFETGVDIKDDASKERAPGSDDYELSNVVSPGCDASPRLQLSHSCHTLSNGCSLSADAEEEMMSLHAFSGCQGMGLEDLLGA